ncbi:MULTISPECIES: ParB/RepB/Spo0J family partition protein [unclassified Novosphingobium]|uniref:ParB/RepB/Spo0J family partition protein n=1 Tax=unclassified Novosphingobium TaxID=2644732 RepID=UPI0025F8AB15|nr:MULTISPECIES: ParB/RepB/Spo0J family partition protein [unclassified Novosphingobium]HQV03464.1 ParB/RepB/Spo0J family partition protein [Novosphingobium sp.]
MSKSLPKLVLSSSRDIPFSQLVLSQKNVRRLKAGLSIEDLAEDIYRRTLLQSLNVRAMVDDDGKETGQFEVPAGGRRFRALELLVKSKRMAKDQPVPCVVREAGIAEEDSLAENVMREGLHPLDQFRAFSALVEAGLSEEDIAARFFVSVSTVRQRLRLASVAPSLLAVYGEDGMSLEQLMAFSVTDNHARQEQVWEQVNQGQHVPAYHIRRLLTEQAIAASDRRVRFIGIDAYTEAGGYVMRDLFSTDDDGWLQDPALVELLVNEKLNEAAQEVGAEGWKWVEAAIDLPYGCERGKRRITGTTVPLTDEEQARLDALVEEYDAIGDEYRDGCDLPDEVDTRLAEIDAELTTLNCRPVTFDAEEQARAGVFVSLAHDGRLRIDRGYVRPEDEPVVEGEVVPVDAEAGQQGTGPAISVGGQVQDEHQADDEDDAIRPLPDRLVSELTAVRTVALRNALAQDAGAAFIAVLHALTLSVFRSHGTHGCVQIGVTQAWLGNVAPDLRETPWSLAIQERHEQWAARLPDEPGALWDALAALAHEDQMALLAHCVSLGVNALFEPVKGYGGQISAHGIACRIAAADALASVVGLDMAEAGWTPTVDNYLGRVTKPRIIEAVRETRGDATAVLIEHLKKGDMAREAERLLEGTGWLPEPLRLPVIEVAEQEAPDTDLPDFLNDEDGEFDPMAIAAE